MAERTYRTRIDDLSTLGEELSEANLRLVAGASGKKLQAGGGKRGDGTSTCVGTLVYQANGAANSEMDGDED